MQTRRITFVTPRYGADVLGGAEQGARSLANMLSRGGWDVRVITSCARSHLTWADSFEPGTAIEEGVKVLRCPVKTLRSSDFDDFSKRILPNASTIDEATALDWIDRQGPDSPSLLQAVASVDEGILAFYPYLYQPTVRSIAHVQVPTVLHAACHDEPPLALPVFKNVFAAADALAHHTRAEQELILERFTSTLNTPQVVLGLPVEISDPVDPLAACEALGLNDEPFALVLGRVDPGKGTNEILQRFSEFRCRTDKGRLVLAGPVAYKPELPSHVTMLGPVPHEHKFGLLAAADMLINPSPRESFSIVLIEAMLVGTPVIVNGWCQPLLEHCRNSSAGLWYTGIADFQAALRRLFDDHLLREAMGQKGREYAQRFFSESAVYGRYELLTRQLFQQPKIAITI